GGNIGFISGIDVVPQDKQHAFQFKGFDGIGPVIRDKVKSVLRGVPDFIDSKYSDQKLWYPAPSLTGKDTKQQVSTNGVDFKDASYNLYNLDPFVWFVHQQLGLSGYGFSLDDDVADVSGNGASNLAIGAGGLTGLPQKAEWTWGAEYGPVTSQQGKIGKYKSDDKYNGFNTI